mmetsp:Transcript_125059/g.399855  ORF Transcript_125059/g.399855 Transcript_125059/m.399855 type:complete len:171 (-) Transcript_125059:340-852(-)
MATDGLVGTPSETWAVKRGDLKWNIQLSSWTWCGCSKGKDTEEGAFVDLDVTIKGSLAAERKNSSSNSSFGLGGGLSLELSRQVLVDKKLQAMSAGFPKVAIQGTATTLTFRFPRITNSALYDPVITGFVSAPAPAPVPVSASDVRKSHGMSWASTLASLAAALAVPSRS